MLEPPLPPRPISSLEAYLHLLKANLGADALALPLAFARAGVSVGAALLLCAAAQGTYAMLLLARLKAALSGSAAAREQLDARAARRHAR